MKKIKAIRWDPIVAKLISDELTQKKCSDVKNIPQKSNSKQDFQTYLHSLFDNDGPPVKYQNPDAWYSYPRNRKNDH